jgi:CheY-like chemotaxis protein
MYAEYLRTCGFRVIACSDSQASLDYARACVPDIILLELRMNRMNGVEVLAQLRKEPSLGHVPVVALTASVLSFERAAAMAAGFTELLPKPCFPEDLANAIMRIVTAAEQGSPRRHGVLRAEQHLESGRGDPMPPRVVAVSTQSSR